ncbi:MAG: family N-acetyltransferase [Marmoricola sp.]|nr:family N-acetyltransferase [Marmoricola sp.]
MSDVVVTDNPEKSRYEAHINGELAGFADYELHPTSIVFTHTEVDPAFEGHGVGSAIIRTSLDEIRAKGERDVVPVCPFYRGWIEKHPDYADLVHHRAEGTP